MFHIKTPFELSNLVIALRGTGDGFLVSARTEKNHQQLVTSVPVRDDGFLVELVRVLREAGLEFEGPPVPTRGELEAQLLEHEQRIASEGGFIENPEEEFKNFPRMRVVYETVVACGGRPTRESLAQCSAIIGAFLDYEIRRALADEPKTDAPPTQPENHAPTQPPVPSAPAGEEFLVIEQRRLEPGQELEVELVASEVIARACVEVVPIEVVSIVSLNIGDEPMPSTMVNDPEPVLRMAKGERAKVKVKSESGVNVGLEVRLRGIRVSGFDPREAGTVVG
jgi:hypothetical protein